MNTSSKSTDIRCPAVIAQMIGVCDTLYDSIQSLNFAEKRIHSIFGGWHEVAVTEVERLGAALARQSGQDEDEAVRQTCHSAAARECCHRH